MVPHTTPCLLFLDHFPDRLLTEAVVRLSSSPHAREVAGAWLTTYQVARAVGRAEGDARLRADAAYRQVVARSCVPPIGQDVERSAA